MVCSRGSQPLGLLPTFSRADIIAAADVKKPAGAGF